MLPLPEFYEADINLLFHKLWAGYYPECRPWCIKSDIDRNTNESIPNDTNQWDCRRIDFPPMPGEWNSGKVTE